MAAPASASASAASAPTSAPKAPTVNARENYGLADRDKRSLIELITEFILVPIDKSMFKILPEIGHLAPIILTAGAFFMASITFSYPLFMFSAASVEAGVFYKILSLFSDYIVTPRFGTISHTTEQNRNSVACESYFQTLTPSRFSLLLGNGIKKEFPNYPLYYITFAATYCIQGILYYSNECTQMGPKYSNRPYLAIMGAAMFILLYTLFLFVYGCESNFLSLISTIVLAAIVGYFICYQNYSMFGKSSVNMLFIPQIIKRKGMDYICVSTADGKDKTPLPADMSKTTPVTPTPSDSSVPYAASIVYYATLATKSGSDEYTKTLDPVSSINTTSAACLCGSVDACNRIDKTPSVLEDLASKTVALLSEMTTSDASYKTAADAYKKAKSSTTNTTSTTTGAINRVSTAYRASLVPVAPGSQTDPTAAGKEMLAALSAVITTLTS